MRKSFLALALFMALASTAQDKMLSIDEAIVGYHLRPSSLYGLQWIPNSTSYSQLKRGENGVYIQISDLKGNTETIALNDLNAALNKSKRDSISSMPFPNWIGARIMGFKHQEEFLAYDLDKKTLSKQFIVHEGASEMVYTSDFSGYAGVIDNGFAYAVNRQYGHVTSGTKGHVIGQAVHRFEFGITNGLFLSPKGKRLAYYYKDESMVSEYPLYNLEGTPAKADMLRYPTAGKSSHHVSVRVKTIGRDQPDVILKVDGPKDQFLTNISWTPDEEHVLVAVVNRNQDKMELRQYNALSGEFERLLFSESNSRYVEPEHPAHFTKHNPDQFVWWSERDGFDHLYLYNADGQLVKQLTEGDWVVTAFHGFNTAGNQLFITATMDGPTERHLYCVDVASGKIKRLTKDEGVHNIQANHDNSLFIDQFSSAEVPGEIRIIDAKGKNISTIHTADNPLKEYQAVEMEIATTKGPGGQDLVYRIFKPADFDPAKKYPAVVYLYNGPHAQLITNSWLGGANLWYHYMAQNGYVVYTIDGRGSANRGFDFESCIHRKMGELEMEDQLHGLNWLKSQSFVDSARVGVHGWSYGGYMTINLMTRKAGNYKVGVAGGPVIDWELYEVMYTERYMDRPDENPEGFEQTDLKNYVDQLEGDLLVIHGGQDDIVLWEHSLEYIQEAIKQGVQLDYFVYPHHKHNVRGKDRVHLYEKISNYFFDHL